MMLSGAAVDFDDAGGGHVNLVADSWEFDLDAASGGARLHLAGGSVLVRPLRWRERLALSRVADLGDAVLERATALAASDSSPLVRSDPGARSAVTVLSAWLESRDVRGAGPAWPLDEARLAAMTLDLWRSAGLSPEQLDQLPAREVEQLWAALGREQAALDRGGSVPSGDTADLGGDPAEGTRILFVDDLSDLAEPPSRRVEAGEPVPPRGRSDEPGLPLAAAQRPSAALAADDVGATRPGGPHHAAPQPTGDSVERSAALAAAEHPQPSGNLRPDTTRLPFVVGRQARDVVRHPARPGIAAFRVLDVAAARAPGGSGSTAPAATPRRESAVWAGWAEGAGPQRSPGAAAGSGGAASTRIPATPPTWTDAAPSRRRTASAPIASPASGRSGLSALGRATRAATLPEPGPRSGMASPPRPTGDFLASAAARQPTQTGVGPGAAIVPAATADDPLGRSLLVAMLADELERAADQLGVPADD